MIRFGIRYDPKEIDGWMLALTNHVIKRGALKPLTVATSDTQQQHSHPKGATNMTFRPKQRATQSDIDDMNRLYNLISDSREPALRSVARSFDNQPEPSDVDRIVSRMGANVEVQYAKAANDSKTQWDQINAAQQRRASKRQRIG